MTAEKKIAQRLQKPVLKFHRFPRNVDRYPSSVHCLCSILILIRSCQIRMHLQPSHEFYLRLASSSWHQSSASSQQFLIPHKWSRFIASLWHALLQSAKYTNSFCSPASPLTSFWARGNHIDILTHRVPGLEVSASISMSFHSSMI